MKSVNDIMPMIGARFYTQLDAAQVKCDVLEGELAKVIHYSVEQALLREIFGNLRVILGKFWTSSSNLRNSRVTLGNR